MVVGRSVLHRPEVLDEAVEEVGEGNTGSPYADYFDIDWDPVTAEIKGKLLLPVLQDGYGEVLHRGDLRVGFEGGSFHLLYFDRRLPIEPRSSAAIMRAGLAASRPTPASDSPEHREYLDIAALLEMLPAAPSCDPNERLGRQQISSLARERFATLAGTSRCRWRVDRRGAGKSQRHAGRAGHVRRPSRPARAPTLPSRVLAHRV